MKQLIFLLFTAGFILLGATCFGETPVKNEIDYLLKQVVQQGCVFIRNFSRHNAEEARDHLNRKYRYFESKIHTAEDFIQLAASKSELTKRPYYVECDGKQKVKSSVWLLNKLQEYRKKVER